MTQCTFSSILGRSQTIEKNPEKKRVIQSDAKQEQSFFHL